MNASSVVVRHQRTLDDLSDRTILHKIGGNALANQRIGDSR